MTEFCRKIIDRKWRLTWQMPAAIEIARNLRRVRPDARVIIGGPHSTLVNAACRSEKSRGLAGRAHAAMGKLLAAFDTVVARDGEEAVFRAVEPGAPKVIDTDDARSPLFLAGPRRDEAPLPARHLIDASLCGAYAPARPKRSSMISPTCTRRTE